MFLHFLFWLLWLNRIFIVGLYTGFVTPPPICAKPLKHKDLTPSSTKQWT
jgi:hypothetical protein